MRIFYTLILYLCVLSAFSQTGRTTINTNGTYLFQKATFTVYNYNTKAQIDSRIITDPSLLNAGELFFQNVFLEATLGNEVLSSCKLPDGLDYAVKDEVELVPAKEYIENQNEVNNRPKRLAPYLLSVQDNILTLTVSYLYGDSKYHFPLEGKLVVTLTKQK